jgi:DNA-directed RNA polymerase alpha subunit
MTSERNAIIVRLYRDGARPADLALQFNISRDRVRQIIDQAKRQDAWHAALVEKYGSHPKINALPDVTPIEVLCLCDTDMRGWSLRVKRFEHPRTIEPIRTLGDLRRITDTELLREPNIGKKILGELRRFCSHRNAGYGGKKYQKRGALSLKLQRRAGPR